MATVPTTITARKLIVAALFLTTVVGGTAQSPASPPMAAAPSPSLDCTTYLAGTYDCLSFVEAGSNQTKPDKACCPELAELVKSQPVCLCQLLSTGGSTFGIQIDINKALKLPSLCSVSTPPVELCSEAGYPIGAPTPSEGPVVGGTAQSPASPPMAAAPSPSLDCTPYLFNTSDCLSFVEAGSNLTKPDKPCCPELAELVNSQPICLCKLLSNGGGDLGIDIDLNKALKLPSLCSVSTPPVQLCSAAGYPIGAPTSSEGPGSMAPMPAIPAAANNDSGASSIAFFYLPFIVGLAIPFFTTHF